jgi:putative transposase
MVPPGCFLGHMKDSLWNMDLFRCESATLRSHWVLVVMDQYTRRIIGFGVHAGRSTVSHSVGCSTAPFDSNAGRQCASSERSALSVPPMASQSADTGGDRNQDIPNVPLSHPFVEGRIGTDAGILVHILFWTTADLENKLLDFRTHFDNHRTHTSWEG